ncbi:hypothetical protein BDZ94DRAFT_1187795 [Collybia nuda]|uniref:Hamartin n=1 Tax=Collybia nuda TaxID=64659 RepID=A0A9P5YBT0_9AGAR|nr:hypothetical protein BDZ94DRAFT_1187795 [Collybia nuda]
MQNTPLIRHVRSVLESNSDALSLHELLISIDDFVLECSSSQEPEVLLFQLEEDIQKVHHDVVDHSSLFQTEIFLAILYHLGPILPPSSVISWFDIVLRPALREPKLPTIAVNHAKELILSALRNTEETYIKQVGDFRCRLLDLYLLDAFNEGSGDDVLEWAELDEEQREKWSHWKRNLEDILLKFGKEKPENLLTEIYVHFADPTSRLQLLMFLNLYGSSSTFDESSAVMAAHPIISSLLFSLFLDTSSTVCAAGLTLFVKLLPIFALHARDKLKSMLPRLLAILARIMCWKERPPSPSFATSDKPPDAEFEQELENEANRLLPIRSDLDWKRLELTFNATTSMPPSPRTYFTILYYLYPSNVLQFLRGPAAYLVNNDVRSPYTLDWDKALLEDEIRRKSEPLLREHVCHPLLIWRDAVAELNEPEFWTRYNVPRITSEAVMLDVRNSTLGIGAQVASIIRREKPEDDNDASDNDEVDVLTQSILPINISAGKASISLQDMISASLALKSNMEVEVIDPISQWAPGIFKSPAQSMHEDSTTLSSGFDPQDIPEQVVQAISGLQREVLLLRNELNFELWLSRENVKHIGRLYQDRILAKTAEAERQGLYNKLRNYRAQVISLEAERREYKNQALSAKNKIAEWNVELMKKLREYREEKKSWLTEAAALRSEEKESQARFAAQGKLLAEATKSVFDLRTQKKETQHKIDRLKDYERQIEQHIKVQSLWEADFTKFNERGDEIIQMRNQYHQMQMRLESLEKTQVEVEDRARVLRRQNQALEARLQQAGRHSHPHVRQQPTFEVSAFAAENSALTAVNTQLKEENMELKDGLEEMRAMLEVLKGQHSGRRGVVSEPRASPLLFT